MQAEKTKQDQQNMLLRMSKKRIFQEGLAALPVLRDSEQDSTSSSRVQTDNEDIPRGQTKKQRLEAKRDEKRNIQERKTAVDEKFTEQGDSMLGAVKELVQIMKEDRQSVIVGLGGDPVAEGLSEQKERVEKLEAEQRHLTNEVKEMKEVALSTAANVAMVLQLLQRGGVVDSEGGIGGPSRR